MIVFTHPPSTEIVKRVKASYTSCIRQTLREEEERKRLVQQHMDECSHFSLATDSALIRNEHVFSCFARFTFEDRVVQTPLFFGVFHGSTGNDIAHWAFNKILEHGPSFEKLVSISTDGASNMVGRNGGMTCALKELIRQHCASSQIPFNDFHCVWCMAHRLNLVTRDFLNEKGISVVKAFCDWFSDRRRQTCYKKFLAQNNVREKLKKTPQPSDTRWLFYHDVVCSILSQSTFVEKFIKQDVDFQEFWSSLKTDQEKYGLNVESELSFEDGWFHSLFLFVKFILEMLGRVNRVFQERYLMIWESWSITQSLKKHIFNVMVRMQHTPPPSFNFLIGIVTEQIGNFISYMQHLLQSISLRFPCPSSSHDMRRMRTSLMIEFDQDSTNLNPFELHCSLSESMDIFVFGQMGDENNNTTLTSPELVDEIHRMREETIQHGQEISQILEERNGTISASVGFGVEMKMSLQEAFKFIQKERHPLLWRQTQQMKTVIPTTVSCEQSFSVFKHALHHNMKNETVMAIVSSKYHQRREDKQI